MRRSARLLTLLAAAAFVLAPVLADAAPGGRSSSGSRGERTYSAPPSTNTAPSAARPMERTATPPSQAARPGAPAAAPAGAAARPGFLARNPMMAGLMGGLLGAGLFGLLAGGGFLGGLGSLAGMMGFLLQIAIIGGLVFLAIALFRRFRQQPAPAGMPNSMMREQQSEPRNMMGGGGALPRGAGKPVDEIGITGADFQSFERTLIEINAAWSREDVPALSRLATPEMVGYFRDDYTALTERGWKNETRDVKLEQGDLSEAWNEGPRDFATVAMRMSLIDVTRDVKTGAVTEGDANARTENTELWTFVRVQGGPWILSAIQQTK